jgi:streptogramin lyase
MYPLNGGKLDPSTGQRASWKTFDGGRPHRLVIARDGKSYVRQDYTYSSSLFVLDGIQ